MAIWYVDSAATGTNAGTSWTNAWTALLSAYDNSSSDSTDVVYVASTHQEALVANANYSMDALTPKNWYCVNKTTGLLEAGGVVGTQSTAYQIVFSTGAA